MKCKFHFHITSYHKRWTCSSPHPGLGARPLAIFSQFFSKVRRFGILGCHDRSSGWLPCYGMKISCYGIGKFLASIFLLCLFKFVAFVVLGFLVPWWYLFFLMFLMRRRSNQNDGLIIITTLLFNVQFHDLEIYLAFCCSPSYDQDLNDLHLTCTGTVGVQGPDHRVIFVPHL